MGSDFRLIMISAMYENGGNTTQRLLDGHPELFAYPFESQLGTKYVNDHFTSMFPMKYRWPVFPLSSDPAGDYETIIDEECKVRIKTPQSSKFRDYPMAMDDRDRKATLRGLHGGSGADPREPDRGVLPSRRRMPGRTTTARAARRSTSATARSSWSTPTRSSPTCPAAHVLHVIRNPWSAYADTKKRAVPLSLAHYITAWCLNQQYALTYAEMYPGRVHILRFEDIVADPVNVLGAFLARVGVAKSDTLSRPTWNGQLLRQVYPWGTIRIPTAEANRATADELTAAEKEEIRVRTKPLLGTLNYETFLKGIRNAA